MPLRKVSRKASKTRKRSVMKANMHELKHSSATIRHTKRKFGAARARKQMIAIALKASGLSRKRRKR